MADPTYDMTTAASLPAGALNIPVLGDDLGWSPGTVGAEKILASVRRTQIGFSFTQAVNAQSDLVFAGQALNMLAFGGPVGGQVGQASGLTVNGFPAVFGNIDYQRSNAYPGGLLCQPGYEFVICAFAVRPVLGFEVPAGVITRGKYIDSYQSELQQLALENTIWTAQRNRETCQILGESLTQYPTDLSSGMAPVSSQNGEPIRGNIHVFPVGIPVGAESGAAIGATPNVNLTMTTRAFTAKADPFSLPAQQLTAAAPLVVALEILMYGYCRDYCPVNNCLPGGGRRQPAPRAMTQIPTPG